MYAYLLQISQSLCVWCSSPSWISLQPNQNLKFFNVYGRTDCRMKGNPISPFRNFIAKGDNQGGRPTIKNLVIYNESSQSSFDSVFGKRVLTYWEILGKYGNSWLQSDGLANSTHGKLYIFGKMRLSSFRKYIVFYAYPKSIHIAVFRSSPFFQVH